MGSLNLFGPQQSITDHPNPPVLSPIPQNPPSVLSSQQSPPILSPVQQVLQTPPPSQQILCSFILLVQLLSQACKDSVQIFPFLHKFLSLVHLIIQSGFIIYVLRRGCALSVAVFH